MNSLIETDSETESTSDDCCSICLDTIEVGSKIKTLKCCNLKCHSTCIDDYFTTKIACPACKEILIPKLQTVIRPTMCIYLYLPNHIIHKTYWNAYTPLSTFLKFLTHFPNITFENLYVKINHRVFKSTESYITLQSPIISLIERDENIVFVNRIT